MKKVQEEKHDAQAANRELSSGEQAAHISLLKETLPLYEEALDVFPMYGLVWFNLARTNQWLGETETLSPNERLTYLHTAIAAYTVTDTYKPRQYLREVDTMKSLCYASLGKLYGQQFGDLDKALDYLQTARRFNSGNAYAAFLLGTVYDLRGTADSAYYYTQQAYLEDTANRDYAENYAQMLQKNVSTGKQNKSVLTEAERLLLKIATRNATLPDNDPHKKAVMVRTLSLLQQNYILQGNMTKAAEQQAALEHLQSY